MNMEAIKGPEGELILKGDFNIYAADQLLDVFRTHLQSSKHVSVNLAEVQNCDPIAVQLLISAEKTARESGKDFRILASSESLRTTCKALGLTESQTEIQSLTHP